MNLEIEEGHSYSIMGRSGSGKTSLISIIGMLNMRVEGGYHYHGRNVRDLSDRERAKLRADKIGFVFQNYSLIAHMRVWENVALPLMYAKSVPRTELRPRALEALEEVGLAKRAHDYPSRLSGGEQQRVAIARALVSDPELMICDEPTGALDRSTGDRVMETLLTLISEKSVTLVMVTHDREIARMCENQLVMDVGRVRHV
ncbi:ABC transporter ATP-binding protein [Arcanobacterium wilhelmae]|uniref:ABC transporter ATP-binding protein n=1 Tax=Arcanobacterium wilhelmae TaxID=1803177 RepID=UPI002414E856|nr:ABC transporter ATP-binding protein [Arcanobacterium wilhelmae]WFN90949.1 ABC transporter ATP-binding protein [Arcanobacterium wilhelmae]